MCISKIKKIIFFFFLIVLLGKGKDDNAVLGYTLLVKNVVQ